MIRSIAISLWLAWTLASPQAAPCAPSDSLAFLTFESGTLVAVDWTARQGHALHTRSVLTQSRVLDAEIELREDETAGVSRATLEDVGTPPQKPFLRAFEEGAIYWSDMIPSSLDQAVLRARRLNQPSVRIRGGSLFRDAYSEIQVDRLGPDDWQVLAHGKRYEVLSDTTGHLLTATLPDYGIVIERRPFFSQAGYPLWAPDAAPPDGVYRARDVSIRAPQGHVLAGTLTIPRGHGRFPAAVLITGLSANNRDNGTPPWMPLRDLADALTRARIAVLRVDDRGVARSTGDRASSTTFDEAEDVKTEIAWLRKQREIDASRIALVGYSEGGTIAPMVASEDPTVTAIVTLAGTGVRGPELARYQIENAVVRDTSVRVADREAEIRKQLADTLTARERSMLSIDPLRYARGVRCPALILQGGCDLHVPTRSAERLASAMRAGGNRDVTVRIFSGVSHSLLPDPLGAGSGWVFLPGFLTDPPILDTVARWTASRLRADVAGKSYNRADDP